MLLHRTIRPANERMDELQSRVKMLFIWERVRMIWAAADQTQK
jgi:hypothetical protein